MESRPVSSVGHHGREEGEEAEASWVERPDIQNSRTAFRRWQSRTLIQKQETRSEKRRSCRCVLTWFVWRARECVHACTAFVVRETISHSRSHSWGEVLFQHEHHDYHHLLYRCHCPYLLICDFLHVFVVPRPLEVTTLNPKFSMDKGHELVCAEVILLHVCSQIIRSFRSIDAPSIDECKPNAAVVFHFSALEEYRCEGLVQCASL